MVTFRLERQCRNNCPLQGIKITRVLTQYSTQVHRVFIAQAKQQSPFRRYANPVASGAEVMTMRRDKSDPALAVRYAKIARRTQGRFGGRDQLMPLLNDRFHLITGAERFVPGVIRNIT